MKLVDTVYDWLGSDPSPDVDEVFAAALTHAEPPYDARITSVLLQRGTEAAWAGLIANYDRLPPSVRQQLHAGANLLHAGAAYALRSAATRGRMNALSLLAECPCPEVAPAVAEALRDSALRVREAAASVLRTIAEQMLTQCPASQPRGFAAPPQATVQHTLLIRALREALRTYDLHLRPDILEACLWYARDLGDSLWNALAARRSRAAYAIEQHLRTWDGPRLTGFLLLALGQPRWERPARNVLRSWTTRTHLLAILDHSDLLAKPLVARHFQLLKHPRWLAAADPALSDMPRAARAQIPYWICHLGFTDAERVSLLKRWLASTFPELRRAAVYALASLGTPRAIQALSEKAAGSGALAQFARWCVAGSPSPTPPGPRARAPSAVPQEPAANEVFP